MQTNRSKIPQSESNDTRNLTILSLLIVCLIFFLSADHLVDGFPVKQNEIVSAQTPQKEGAPPVETPEKKPQKIHTEDLKKAEEFLSVTQYVFQAEIPDNPYPELYGNNPQQRFFPKEEKVVYLTFDDGPSSVTPSLLDMLLEEQVPATFFVVGNTPHKRELIGRIHREGHVLGVHSFSHQYDYIYWNKEAYLADFSRQYNLIREVTGYSPSIYRFPGGSVNSYNRHLYRDLIAEMKLRGFVYYDWNVLSGDSEGVLDPDDQLNQLISLSETKSRIIALLHDTEKNPQIASVVRNYIHYMKDMGFRFLPLSSAVEPVCFPFTK